MKDQENNKPAAADLVAELEGDEMPPLPYHCASCYVQQFAPGRCANCGRNQVVANPAYCVANCEKDHHF